MSNIVIEANTRNQLIFAISVLRKEVNLKKIKKIYLLEGHINSIKPIIFDIINYLSKMGLKVVKTNRKNFLKDINKKDKIYSFYTFSYVPIMFLKYKIFNLSPAHIIRYEEGTGNYAGLLGLMYAYYVHGYYFYMLRTPITIILKKMLDFVGLTVDHYLINPDNTIQKKLRKSIIKTIVDIHLYNHKKKKFKIIACVNSVEELKKLSKIIINSSNSILYKPHPRWFIHSNTIKYNKKIYSGHLTCEELAFIYKIPTIWSFNSSSLLYCSILLHCRCYNVVVKGSYFSKRLDNLFTKYTKVTKLIK